VIKFQALRLRDWHFAFAKPIMQVTENLSEIELQIISTLYLYIGAVKSIGDKMTFPYLILY
jgi:hypothetical protein